jgi:mannosyltransferase OCH1-like enzyme
VIPKKVHLSWKSKDILDCPLPIITHGVRRLADLNPDWEFEVSDDADVEAYLAANLNADDYARVKHVGIVEKLDVWRLVKMFLEGGLYLDVDRLCNVRLSDLAQDGIKCVLPTCWKYDFSQDFMMSAPGNPIHAKTLLLNLQRRKEGQVNVYLLGAQTYMHAISLVLTGSIVNTDPGEEAFDALLEKINAASFLATYMEDPPYNTVLFRNEGAPFDHEQEKRRLYAEYGLKHWTGDW